MKNRDKARKILSKFSDLDNGVQDVYKSLDTEVSSILDKLKKVTQVKTLEEANEQFKKLEKLFKPLIPAFDELKVKLNERDSKILALIQDRTNTLQSLINEANTSVTVDREASYEQVTSLRSEIDSLKESLSQSPDYAKTIQESENKIFALIGSIEEGITSKEDFEKVQKSIKDAETNVEDIRKDLIGRINNLAGRGGSANQQINVNSSVMSSNYADINFVSNTAIRWVATDDNTNKRVNIVASLISGGAGVGGASLNVTEADGVPYVSSVTTIVVSNGTLTDDGGGQVTISTGGGSGGITRISSTISVSSTFANASQTDYVAFANTGIALTLPVASSGNLYTVKNISGSSVLVVAGEGVDGSPSALMPSNYESLSFISNGSVWGVV